MFFTDRKKVAGSIVDHFDSKLPREIDERPNFKEAPVSKMAKGGEADDEDHMQALASHSEEMHEAMKSGDHMRHAKAMKAFLQEHESHNKKED